MQSQRYRNEGEDPYLYCRSVPALLDRPHYAEKYSNVYKNRTTQDRTDSDYEASALEYLGKLFWFGVTERMAESMCLLNYDLRVPYRKEIPETRKNECSPSS